MNIERIISDLKIEIIYFSLEEITFRPLTRRYGSILEQ